MKILLANLSISVVLLTIFQNAPVIQSHEQSPAASSRGVRQGGQGQGQQCRDKGPSSQPVSVYHAPARTVPAPPVDTNLKREFLLLFHAGANHSHGQAGNDVAGPPALDKNTLAIISELCPRTGFFYSFAPRHFNATMILQRIFMQQPNPRALLDFARKVLYSHEINRRVWYYALLGATLSRPDCNGYYLAWAIDATPDMYLPATVLNKAMEGTSYAPVIKPANGCGAAGGQQGGGRPQPTQKPRRNGRSPQNSWGRASRGKQGRNGGWGSSGGGGRGSSGGSGQKGRVDKCIVYNGTSGATSPAENRLWYFREDIMVLEHHWYWHQYYPQVSTRHPDRRGEVFYFAHRYIIARYNAERLANGLKIETPLDMRLNGNIGDGYDADLVDKQSGNFWTPRQGQRKLSDIMHQTDPDFQLTAPMNDVTQLHKLIQTHISQGFLMANRSRQTGQPPTEYRLDIKNPEGFSHLGNTVEAAEELSVHVNLYHAYGIHNLGHVAVGLASDPNFQCRLPPGVMADLTVTMRDPAFYKVHTMVDEIFHQYKDTLPPYKLNGGEWPLTWEGVHLRNIELLSATGAKNYVKTFWGKMRLPLEEGIDMSVHRGDLNAEICHIHLNHEVFTFRLTVDVNGCMKSSSKKGTARIFMAPRFNHDGKRFTMKETRKMMFQLDAFPVELKRGRNTITRHSRDSSSTKPWSRSLNQMLQDPNNEGRTEYCGCGWPEHMYMPKGTTKGMEFDLFAMITNYDQDRVQDTREDLRIPEPCNSPYLFCGVPYRKYPDARPLNYPFDRLPYSVGGGRGGEKQVGNLEEYAKHVPNADACVVTVQHVDNVIG